MCSITKYFRSSSLEMEGEMFLQIHCQFACHRKLGHYLQNNITHLQNYTNFEEEDKKFTISNTVIYDAGT